MKTIVDLETDLVKPYIDAEDKKFAANIAPVETSPATGAHAVGSQIIYNGVLYDVTAAIAATDALVVGTNIAEADDIVTQIAAKADATALENEVVTRAKLGGHNLLGITITSQVKNTTQITVNDDGSITFQGTPTSDFSLSLAKIDASLAESNVDYILTGGNSEIPIVIGGKGSDSGSGLSFRNAAIGSDIFITITTSFSGTVTLYPMIRLATDADTTYQPYAKTNRELTELALIHTTGIVDSITPGTNVTIQTKYGYKHGNHVHLEISCVCSTAAASTTDFFTIPIELGPYLTRTVGFVVISNEHIYAGSFTFVQNADGLGARQGATGSIPANTPITFIGDWYTN